MGKELQLKGPVISEYMKSPIVTVLPQYRAYVLRAYSLCF